MKIISFLTISLILFFSPSIYSELGGAKLNNTIRNCGKYGRYTSNGRCRTLKGWCKLSRNKKKRACKRKPAKRPPKNVNYNKRSCSKYGRYRSNGRCRTLAGWCKLNKNRNKGVCKGSNTSAGPSGTVVKAKKGAVFPVAKCYGLKNKGGLGHFGAPRRNGKRRYKHTGIDWYAPRGTLLRSPWGGRIISCVKGKRSGHTVRIQHDNGMQTVYMHMDKKFCKRKRVKAGQQIGTVGNSGNARRQHTHVHFELKNSRGQRVNPASVFGCTKASGK